MLFSFVLKNKTKHFDKFSKAVFSTICFFCLFRQMKEREAAASRSEAPSSASVVSRTSSTAGESVGGGGAAGDFAGSFSSTTLPSAAAALEASSSLEGGGGGGDTPGGGGGGAGGDPAIARMDRGDSKRSTTRYVKSSPPFNPSMLSADFFVGRTAVP